MYIVYALELEILFNSHSNFFQFIVLKYVYVYYIVKFIIFLKKVGTELREGRKCSLI